MTRPHPIVIPHDVLQAVYQHARQTFPAECCGWLAGSVPGEVTRVRPCQNACSRQGPENRHPTAMDRDAETAYVIAGDDLITLSHELDGAEPPRVIYHSHPNGRAYFSDTDRTVATDPWGGGPSYPVQHLVVGVDTIRVVEAKLFAWEDETRSFVEVGCFPGAAAAEELDLLGEVCPFTFVRARLRLEELPLGSRLRVLVDHEPAAQNVPRSLTAWGQKVLEVAPAGHGRWHIVVEKTRP